ALPTPTVDANGITIGGAGAPAAILLTGPGSTMVNVASTDFTITVVDAHDNPSPVGEPTTFTLMSSSGVTATFTPASPATVLMNESTVTFTYADSVEGTYTVTATWATGDTPLGADTHEIEVQPAGD
ncbi:MAG: hypothetical protein WEG36_10155, partial [Gemmatimonadota bacterium]